MDLIQTFVEESIVNYMKATKQYLFVFLMTLFFSQTQSNAIKRFVKSVFQS